MHAAKNTIVAGLLLVPALLFAAPVPKLDSANFDVGVLREGATTTVKHTFYIKNIGDSTLKLTWVRARCGCTAVSYDSIIPVGKTGALVAQVNPENFPEGPFEKTIAIGFNNEKFAQEVVTVHGIWKHLVSVSPDQVTFAYGNIPDSGVSLTIATEQKNFNVLTVSFQINQDSPMDWSSSIPLNFTLSKIPDAMSIKPANAKPETAATPTGPAYKLTIRYASHEKQDRYGQIVIKTNIPGKPEIKVSGILQGHKQ